MLRIGICDDESYARKALKDLLQECCDEEDLKAEFQEFDSGEEYLEKNPMIDALFLDIEMVGMSGYEVAKELRRQGSSVEIIIETSHTSMFKEAFDIGALQFITKSFDKEEVKNAINQLIKKRNLQTLKVKHERKEYVINQNDIICLRAKYGGTEISTDEKVFIHYETLEKMIEKLNSNFIGVNRDLILNLGFVKEINGTKITLKNGELVEVSRRRKKDFNNRYIEYKSKQ